jgi:hypothetical protein
MTIEQFEKFKFFIELYRKKTLQFTAFHNCIDKCMQEGVEKHKTELINSFESYISIVQDICIFKLDGHMSNNQFLKFKGFIKETVELKVIQNYYKIIGQEFKEENYALIFNTYNQFCKQ